MPHMATGCVATALMNVVDLDEGDVIRWGARRCVPYRCFFFILYHTSVCR